MSDSINLTLSLTINSDGTGHLNAGDKAQYEYNVKAALNVKNNYNDTLKQLEITIGQTNTGASATRIIRLQYTGSTNDKLKKSTGNNFYTSESDNPTSATAINITTDKQIVADENYVISVEYLFNNGPHYQYNLENVTGSVLLGTEGLGNLHGTGGIYKKDDPGTGIIIYGDDISND